MRFKWLKRIILSYKIKIYDKHTKDKGIGGFYEFADWGGAPQLDAKTEVGEGMRVNPSTSLLFTDNKTGN